MSVYLDTMLWVYHLEDHPVLGPPVSELAYRLGQQRETVLSSLFVLSEILVAPTRKQNKFATVQLRRFFLSSAIVLEPYDLDAVEHYAQLRASTRVKPLDALHLAVAASAKADVFITGDQQLHRLTVSGVGRICSPEELLAQ